MKTAEEKTGEVCRKLNLPEDGPAFSVIRRAIIEQDRDTRHACAEALAFSDEDNDVIIGNAIRVCMNVKAV